MSSMTHATLVTSKMLYIDTCEMATKSMEFWVKLAFSYIKHRDLIFQKNENLKEAWQCWQASFQKVS
jgi:hypothetical protein